MGWVERELAACAEKGDTTSAHYLGLVRQQRANETLAGLREAGRAGREEMVRRAHADLDQARAQIRRGAPKRLAAIEAAKRDNELAAIRHAEFARLHPQGDGLADSGEWVGEHPGWEGITRDASAQRMADADVDRQIAVQGHDPDTLDEENRALGTPGVPVAQAPTQRPRGRRG
jgi:hypothetical protein